MGSYKKFSNRIIIYNKREPQFFEQMTRICVSYILGGTQIDQLKFCNKPWYSKGISLYELAQICNKEKNLQDANEYFGQARDSFQQAIEKDPHDAGSI